MRVRDKKLALAVLFLLSLATGSAEARLQKAKGKIPLLPPRYELASVESEVPPVVPDLDNSAYTQPKAPVAAASSVGYGLELGVLGRSVQTSATLSDTQLAFGGRIFADVLLLEDLALRPSVGYFVRRHRDTGVDTFQNEIELGLSALYAVFNGVETQVWMGGAARLSGSFNYLMTAGQTTPLEYKPRFGPVLSLGFRLTDEVNFLISAEGGLEAFRSTRAYGNLTSGFLFRLK